jgi:hypothetical protein
MNARWTHHPLPDGWTLATRPTLACGEPSLVAVPTPPGGDPDTAPASHGYVIDADNAEQLAALLGTVAAEVRAGEGPVRYAAAAPAAPVPSAPEAAPAPAPEAPASSTPRSASGWIARDVAAQRDAFAPLAEARTFTDRAAAVSCARRRSAAGVPCDVYGPDGALVYTRSMDLAAQRAQLGLF